MERIGHYTIVSELGRGGMGVVYKAHEESLNRFVAIKMLGEHLESDRDYVERFVREARSAAALSHPNIVQIYSISEENGHHYFVMEYVQGTSVERLIRTRGKLEPAAAVRLILQAADGLEAAHAQGVIHRDIKPANLMVTDRGLVKIADFGLALMGTATTRLTATGMLMGTPGYLSPEQCLDQGTDRRTDIYSLGVTLFEMVTGTMPFRADSPLALLKLIVEVEPPDVRQLNPEVDEELRGIIARMLAKDRDQRFADCSEVIAALRAWLGAHGEPLPDRPDATAVAPAVPPPPPTATDHDLNTQPTVAVPSGATAGEQPAAAPSPPPPPMEVSAYASAPDGQPRTVARRGRTGLIVAAVVIFVLVCAAVATVLTVKSGILDRFFGNAKPAIAALDEGAATPSHGTDHSAPGPPAVPVAQEGAGDAPSLAAGDRAESSPTDARQSGPPAVGEQPTPSPRRAVATAPRTTSVPAPVEESASASRSQPASEPEPRIESPPPTGTVVLAIGERLLAVEAERYLKDRLVRAGVEVVEVTSIPGFEGFVDTEARPEPERLRSALRPYARYLVAVRIDYLGDRQLVYMGQRDTAFQARVSLALVDLANDRLLGRPKITTVEYTRLNADEVVDRELRKIATGLIQELPRE